jgi:hypothetical protein
MKIKMNFMQYVAALFLFVMISANAYSQSSYEVVEIGGVTYVISEDANVKTPLPGYITIGTSITEARDNFVSHYNGFFSLTTKADRENWMSTYSATAKSMISDNQVLIMMYGVAFGKVSTESGLEY